MEKLDAKAEKNKLGVNDKGEVTGTSSGTLTTTANGKKTLHEEHSIQNTTGKSSKDEEINEIIPSSGYTPDQSSDFIEQGLAQGDSNIRLESEPHNLFMSSSFEELGLTKETEPPHISRLMKVLVWFNPYRQAFFMIVWINILMIILNLVKRFPYSDHNLSTFVTGNILAAILFRNEWFLRFLHWAAVQFSRPRAFSVKARVTMVGIIYHIGGVHSGCGLAVLLWLFLSCYKVITDQTQMHLATFAVLILSTTCVLITCLTATPIVRKPCHNLFEFIHRFVGWIGILSTFAFLILRGISTPQSIDVTRLRIRWVTHHPDFKLLIMISILIISSWISLTRIPVEYYAETDKVTVIKFPGGLTSGLHSRISTGGLREWHIFGSISEGKGSGCHYVVAGVVGGFTRKLNATQPNRLYTKLWKPAGLPYFSRMFSKGVAVCSGVGIGGVGSTCIQHPSWFLIWIGADLKKVFGPVYELIESKIPEDRRVIWDTRVLQGRPDVVSLLEETYRSWDAEVVLFIGNPKLNKTVLRTAFAKKIPVFGSIWDA